MESPQYKTWIEIDKEALSHNIKVFRSILNKKTKLFAVVKSNAYGHGLALFSRLADRLGVDGFCVDSAIEGQKLREKGIKKTILVLGTTLAINFAEAAKNNITITVSNFDTLKSLLRSRKIPDFHLKIDTGMHRQGFYLDDLSKVIKILQSCNPAISQFKGAYTHFAAAKNLSFQSFTLRQLKEFEKAKDFINKAAFRNILFHAAATGGAMLYPQSHFDAVRIGIGLYGYSPTKEVGRNHKKIWHRRLSLAPVLSWRSVVSEVKDLLPGMGVGYDLTEEVKKKTRSVIVPVGYWHGFPRSLSSSGEVLIKGRKAKVLGRVSMDMLVVGLPINSSVKIGDQVTIIGKDGRNFISAEEIAKKAGTINYEIITRINPLIKRYNV